MKRPASDVEAAVAVRALRGAITIDDDSSEEVVARTAELLNEMMALNDVSKEHLISIVFSATSDITSEFPAAGARRLGISDIPMLCTKELDIIGAIPRVIRVLMHLETDKGYDTLRHVYLGDAKALRTDLRQ
jgi:chorismate mutase